MRFFINFLLIAGFCAGAGPLLNGADYLRPSAPSGIDHSRYEELLQKYVNARGLVDYGAWKADRKDMERLNQYFEQFAPAPGPKIPIGEEAASLMKLPVASYGVSKKEIHDHHSINCCNCFFGLPCFLT